MRWFLVVVLLAAGCGFGAERFNDEGRACIARGDNIGATRAFAAAVKRDPDVAKYHYNLANALARRGLYDQAILETREALRLDPAYTKASILLAWLSERTADRQADAIAGVLN